MRRDREKEENARIESVPLGHPNTWAHKHNSIYILHHQEDLTMKYKKCKS